MHLDSGPVTWPAIVVHGGAGTYRQLFEDGSDRAAHIARLSGAVAGAARAGWAVLTQGRGDPLRAVVAAVELLEQDGGFNAGLGAVPTTSGTIEMDAGVMDDRGRAGAVACISSHVPVRAAEAVYRARGPVLLAGPNADAFAHAAGVPGMRIGRDEPEGTVGPARLRPPSQEGTVGAVAVSSDGRFAAATSTGGLSGQLPGRVGDTPVPGAGVWAQRGCAVSATGAGEAFLLAGFSRLVAQRHHAGEPLDEAMAAALQAVNEYKGHGGGIALGSDGTWTAAFDTAAMARALHHRAGRHAAVLP